MLALISDSLTDCQIFVGHEVQYYAAHNINAGVPWSFGLGPSLFLLYINGEPHGVFINCGDRKRGGAAAAVGSPKSKATSNYTAAAVFPRSHNVAVTYVFIFGGAAWRIYKLWRPKTWGCHTVFDLMSHGDLRAFLQRP